MYINDWKKEFLNVPNLLSLFRLALIPVYIGIYLHAQDAREYVLAGSILALSCLTDMLDGYIARRFHMITNVGKVLDPIADKMTQLTLTLCLSVKYPVLRYVLILFLAKELFQVLVMIMMFRRGKILSGSLFPGKICTAILFLSFIVMILFPSINKGIIDIIAAVDTLFLLYAFIGYYLAYFGKNPKLQNAD